MIENLLADVWNGFSPRDLPFLFIQLSGSCLMAWIIRIYWVKTTLTANENSLTRYIIPLQAVFTLLAIFAQRSPWVAVVFGLSLLILAFSGEQLTLRSRVFFMISMAAAWGMGSGNIVVTVIVYIVLVWPFIHLEASAKK